MINRQTERKSEVGEVCEKCHSICNDDDDSKCISNNSNNENKDGDSNNGSSY